MTTKQLTVGIAVAAAFGVVGVFFIGMIPFTVSAPDAFQNGGLVTQDIAVGSGDSAKPGDTISVNYTGQLESGVVFDTSVGRAPYTFVLGAGTVIAGWEQGLVGMQVGGKRLLVIPALVGYGATGYGPIPPNATLIFDVELVSIKPGPTSQ